MGEKVHRPVAVDYIVAGYVIADALSHKYFQAEFYSVFLFLFPVAAPRSLLDRQYSYGKLMSARIQKRKFEQSKPPKT